MNYKGIPIREDFIVKMNRIKKGRKFKKIKKRYNICYISLFIIIFICFIIIIFLICYVYKENSDLIKKIQKLNRENEEYKAKFNNIKKQTEIELTDKYINFKKIANNTNNKYIGLENCIFRKEKDCIYEFLIPKKVIGKKMQLIGPKGDGGYVLMDDFHNISIAYSFGISGDVSFDADLARKNIDIYMYDHTIKRLPYNNSKFHWQKIGITGNIQNNKSLQTLKEILHNNGHLNEKNMILKMDVEHSEWESLINTPDEILKKFKYIAIEYHFDKKKKMNLYYNVLKKLQNTHQVFYLHCNNCGGYFYFGNFTICNALEVSYIIKEGNQFEKDESVYPIPEFDFKNCFKPPLDFNLNLLKFYDN